MPKNLPDHWTYIASIMFSTLCEVNNLGQTGGLEASNSGFGY